MEFVRHVLAKLTPAEDIERQALFYAWGRAKFGQHWRYADVTTTVRAAALYVQPATYLEIGVHRGRSAAVVAATCPQCTIYGFDLWPARYAGAESPGPEFVRGELRSAGHVGEVVLVPGNSRETVPAILTEHPDLFFDLITVDGDHTVVGAATDLASALPRLKVGGVVVFDDICRAPLLMSVWDRLVRRDSRYVTWEFTADGFGVAAAIRISQSPALGEYGASELS